MVGVIYQKGIQVFTANLCETLWIFPPSLHLGSGVLLPPWLRYKPVSHRVPMNPGGHIQSPSILWHTPPFRHSEQSLSQFTPHFLLGQSEEEKERVFIFSSEAYTECKCGLSSADWTSSYATVRSTYAKLSSDCRCDLTWKGQKTVIWDMK